MRIEAEIDVDGDTLRPFQIDSRPPGRVLVMQLDTATHISITIEGPLGTDRVMFLHPRIFDYTGSGTYPIATKELPGPGSRLASGFRIAKDRERIGFLAGTASSGEVTITSLNLV